LFSDSNGLQYAGELHFVYRNPLTLRLAVLGVFMQSVVLGNESDADTSHFFDEETRHEWKRFFDQAQTLKEENDSVLFHLNLAWLMGENMQDFWRYEGSLTTPPCTEGITWTLFKQPIMFVESEFRSFRQNIYFEDYRRPQPLHNRILYRNFLKESYSTVPDYNCCPRASGNRTPMDAVSACARVFSSFDSVFIVIAIAVILS
jgi:carbonic anhydrase